MLRRWLAIGGAVVGGLVVLAVVAVLVLYGTIGAYVVRHKVVPRLERKLGRHVEIGDVDVSRGEVVLRDVVIAGAAEGDAPLARIAEIRADFDYGKSLRGEVDLGRVTISGADVRLVRERGGDNFKDLVDRLRGARAADGSASVSSGHLRPKEVAIEDAHLELRDGKDGVTFVAEGVDGRAEPGGEINLALGDVVALTAMGPYAKAERVVVTASLHDPLATARAIVGGGEIHLWRNMDLTGLSGAVAQGDQPGRLVVSLTGGYAGAPDKLWRAEGWVDPRAATGKLALKADRFTFDKIRPVLEHSAVIDFDHTSLDVALDLEIAAGVAHFTGNVGLEGLNLFHAGLADAPIRGLGLLGEIDGIYDHRARRLELRRAAASFRGVEYELVGTAELAGGVDPDGLIRTARRLTAELTVPPVPCQAMLESVPAELAPHLQGFQLTGSFQTDLSVAIDWANLEATQLGGSVGIRGCKVKQAPKGMDAKHLMESFDNEVEVAEDVWKPMTIGPENPDYAPLDQIAPYLPSSLMTTEDSGFYEHHGYIIREFRTALIKDLEAGYFKFGASSITMQTVKNVLLYREKTLARKFQELFLTWYIESVLPKDRIMEIYVNAIEYGPGLYGIGAAAQQYFGKAPRDLNPVEAAFFSSILPAPKRRYVQFCKDRLFPWTETKIERILEFMWKRGRLTDAEYQLALATPLVFQPDKHDFCTRKWSKKK